MPISADRPRLVGDGPVTCSTSQVLTLLPVYDVNRYYADLGVGVRATKHEIARRYQEVGQHDSHLTFVVKQLLNREVRRAYDACPLGTVFLDDEVRERLRHARARAVSAAGGTVPPEPTTKTPAPAGLDSGSKEVHDQQEPGWGYAHYLWSANQADPARLAEWQCALVSAVAARGLIAQIAVGMSGGDRPPVEVVAVGMRIVAFLHEHHRTTDALAQQAVSPVVELVESLADRKISWVDSVPVPTRPRRPRSPRARSPRPTTSPSTTGRRPSSGS